MSLAGVRTVYTPHKETGKNYVDVNGIKIKLLPCPLYAVNVEDTARNSEFNNIDLINRNTKYLYSFKGAWEPHYISNIRQNIFNMTHRDDTVIENIGKWHFGKDVYSNIQTKLGKVDNSEDKQNRTSEYNNLLLDSKFSLCPSGAGPNSIRFWESLAVGCIPVLLADTLELPEHKDWDKAILRVSEYNVNNLEILRDITEDEVIERRKKCIEIYNHFKKNYRNTEKVISNKLSENIRSDEDHMSLVSYCCGSYYNGNYGGVAQFDYHLKSLFTNRVFFQGPSQKSQLLEYLKKNPNSIIITDNHLSCDIPNEYKVFIVHHGCAITTAKRNPDWKEPWKSLCTNGQNKMLDFRKNNNTEIISCSQSCINDFTKYFGDKYTKFKIHKLLHTSSFNLELKKTKFNTKNPIILGNWDYGKKGKHIVDKLKNINSKFRYLELNVKPNNGNIEKFIEDKNVS